MLSREESPSKKTLTDITEVKTYNFVGQISLKSKSLPNAVFTCMKKNARLMRYSLIHNKPAYVTNFEVAMVDQLHEDKYNNIWMVSVRKDKRIVQFNRMMYITSIVDLSYHHQEEISVLSYDRCEVSVMNNKKDKMYYLLGNGKIGVLAVISETAEEQSNYRSGVTSGGQSLKTVGRDENYEVSTMKEVVGNKMIFGMCISKDDQLLIVDEGDRYIRTVDVTTHSSKMLHIDTIDCKISSPTPTQTQDLYICTHSTKSSLIITLLKITLSTVSIISTKSINTSMQFDRVLYMKNHSNNTFIVHTHNNNILYVILPPHEDSITIFPLHNTSLFVKNNSQGMVDSQFIDGSIFLYYIDRCSVLSLSL